MTKAAAKGGAVKTTAKAAAKTGPKTAASKSAQKPAKKAAKKPAAPSASPSAAPSTAEAQLTEYRRKRDFTRTAEPAGASARAKHVPQKNAPKHVPKHVPKAGELRFVIQKHAASHLHYDLRLEVDGVMKSWAVPKGPSADPKVKRLAMQVEDHPVEYNSFEGTIPAGEYGGGTVMLWDSGTYTIENPDDRTQNSAAHDEYDRGELKLDFHGKRIQGSYALVRTKGGMRGNSSSKPSWLLIKHRDDNARPEEDFDLTREFTNSVVTGRTMDEIRDGS